MKYWSFRSKHWAYRIIVIVAMLLGIGGMPEATIADCEPDEENPTVLRVDANTPADPLDQDGESWDCAFEDLQDALDRINEPLSSFDTIWVAAGTYKPSVENDLNNSGGSDARRRTFTIPPGIAVLGGFPTGGGDGTINARNPAEYVTILSGDLGTVDVASDNAYHVLVLLGAGEAQLSSILIDGFTITAGNANGSSLNSLGGGAHVYDTMETQDFPANPSFVRCKFTNNNASASGGAILARKAGVTARDCEFRNNTTGGTGTAEYAGGGAISTVGTTRAINSKFVINSSTNNDGGGIRSTGPTTLVRCEFFANSAEFGGGASITGTVVSSLFAGNQATNGSGGGLFGGAVHGCTFADNFASNLGGGRCEPDWCDELDFLGQ